MRTSLLKQRQQLLRRYFPAWQKHYLSPHFRLADSSFHAWLDGELATFHRRRGSRLNLVAPRGAAKSTRAGEAYPLYCACEGIEPYIVITSDTGPQAEKRLETIRLELDSNELLARDYPDAFGQGPVWRQDQIVLRNGVRIEAAGTGTKLRGRKWLRNRPTLIIVDDPQNTEHIISQLQRERSWEWLTKDVCNAGGPETNIIALGTALHRDCIVLKLCRTGGWRSRVFQSIIAWPERMDLWEKWDELYCNWHMGEDQQWRGDREGLALAFYHANQSAMDAGAHVLWPERESLYQLMELRATAGHSAFASEKQSSPINPEACEWPESYFDGPGFWFEKWPERGLNLRVLALDPSKGKDAKTGDYSAFVKLARHDDGTLYVEADLKRRPVDQIVADGVEHVRRCGPNGLDGFGIEVNQFQELLVNDFLREGKARGVHLPIFTIDNSLNKQVRIRRLGPYLAQRQIRFHATSPGTRLLVDQLKDFPVGDHDDGPDALEMALRLAIELWNGRQQNPGPVRLRP